jgi:transcriptional regulator
MYTPAAFVEERPEVIAAFLAAHPMAQLVTMTEDGLVATPLPMLYEPSPDGLGSMVGHVARANRQWTKSVADVEALAIFTGSNAYISPNWYASKGEHGKVVPTWNYETVHIRGHFVARDDTEWKRALVTRLTQHHESQFAEPWTVTDAPPDYIDSMLKAIVGIELQITSIQAKRKLSQNRPEADIAGTIAGLTDIGGDSALVADAMRWGP